MKTILINVLISGIICLLGQQQLPSASLPQAVDPIFGLKFDSTEVKFEPAPSNLYSACKELTNEGWGRKMWILAESANPKDQYIIVGGYYLKKSSDDQSTSTMEADSRGAVIRLKGDHCELIDPANEVFYPTDKIGTPKLKELANDVVRRYACAFGSTKQFLEALHDQHVNLNNPRSSILKDAVSAAREKGLNE